MTSENKDWGGRIGCSVLFLMIAIGIIQTDPVKEIYDPCTYPVGKVLNITIPTEQNTLMYETIILQKKTHCDDNLFIHIVDKVFIPRDFMGTLRVEITKIMSPYRYSAKIIHIKPTKG